MNSDMRFAELRSRAAEILKAKRSSIERMPVEDVRKLVEELQIHQVELEMQNEELRSTQVELEQSKKKYTDLYDYAPVGYMTIDEEGRIHEANLTAAKQLGIERTMLIGKPFNLYVANNYRDEVHLHLRTVLRTGQPHTCEIELQGRGPVGCYIQLDTTCAEDAEGRGLVRTAMTDISDRKQAEEKLKAFAAKLEQSNRDLEEFAFIASHDLQEPLRKIKTFGDLIAKKHNEGLDETTKDFIARMRNAADRMQHFIGDLLKYSRISTRSQPLGVVNLREAVMEAVVDLELKIERTEATVEVSDLPAIEAEKSQMRHLFQNIIANALKFHRKEKPHVKIFSQLTEDDRCRIFVEDNGIGFDEQYLDRMFLPFQRLHGRSEYGGTGMGLAICQKIIERHGGSITAKSKPGEGSSFIITLPVKQNTR